MNASCHLPDFLVFRIFLAISAPMKEDSFGFDLDPVPVDHFQPPAALVGLVLFAAGKECREKSY